MRNQLSIVFDFKIIIVGFIIKMKKKCCLANIIEMNHRKNSNP